MDIGLMTHIPDYFVIRALESPVQGQGQFYNSQVGCQMAAGFGNCMYKKPADFSGELF